MARAETDHGQDDDPPTPIVLHPDTAPPEREYVLDAVFDGFLGLDHRSETEDRDDIEIRLGDGSVVLPDLLLDAAHDRSPAELEPPEPPIATWDPDGPFSEAAVAPGLPVPFGRRLDGDVWARVDGRRVELGLDVLGTAFFMLSRLEEVASDARDDHGRFPAQASLAHRAGFLDRPIVDEHVEVLRIAMEQAADRSLPRPGRFAVRPTHDLDHPWDLVDRPTAEAIRDVARDLVERGDPTGAADRLARLALVRLGRPGADPFATWDVLMEESEARGVRSTFHVRADPTGDPGRPPPSPDDPRFGQILQAITDRGHRIGLHPSFAASDDPDRLVDEADRLRDALSGLGIDAPVESNRMHYLRFRAPGTWRALERAGVAEDSSVMYPTRAGFRSGTCHPHPVFDVEERRTLDVVERPPIVMDATLLGHMDLDRGSARQEAWGLRERCRRVAGEWTVVWHNDRLRRRADRRLYREVLDGAAEGPSDP